MSTPTAADITISQVISLTIPPTIQPTIPTTIPTTIPPTIQPTIQSTIANSNDTTSADCNIITDTSISATSEQQTINGFDDINTKSTTNTLFDTKYIQNININKILDVIKCATSVGGHVFGGYVRNVIVPRHHHPCCDVQWNDIDLWFRNDESANAFLVLIKNKMNMLLHVEHDHLDHHSHRLYTFARTMYVLQDGHGQHISYIDIIISDTYPVNDYDVNHLTCQLKSRKDGFIFGYQGCYNDDQYKILIQQKMTNIDEKKATMNPTYYHNLMVNPDVRNSNYRNWLKKNHQQRLMSKYIQAGWTVTLPHHTIIPRFSSDSEVEHLLVSTHF